MSETTTAPGPNHEAITAWDTVLFDKYVRFRDIMIPGCAMHGRVALERLGSLTGKRIVDLGCGFGDATLELARLAGPGGAVVGIDSSPRFIESAAREGRSADVAHATFRVADVESDALGGPYDLAFSRMGMMFFASPVRALRNIKQALAPGGRLSMIVWRKREDNEFIHTAEVVAKSLLPEPNHTDAVTCGPGPFSMSGADLVSDQLVRAGFRDISFERSDIPFRIGESMDAAIDFVLALGPAGEVVRLAGEEGERRRPQLSAALREALAPYVEPDGSLSARSSTWLVTASPGQDTSR
jgi:SAM-dependent methyltransferase